MLPSGSNRSRLTKRVIASTYRLSGRAAYAVVKPLLRRYLKNSRRSYLLMNDAEQVLLVRNWLGGNVWSLPGGGAHAGESLQAAAIREVREELGIGISPASITQVAQGAWRSNGFEFQYLISSAIYSGDVPKKRLFEITDARLFSFQDAAALTNVAPEIRRAITILRDRTPPATRTE